MSRKWGGPELDRSQFALDQFHSALKKLRGGTATAADIRLARWQAIMQEPVETLRACYRPERIKTLFVGESPPINGRFFYDGNNPLLTFMSEAIESALPGEGNFLNRFRENGWYLDDLVLTPVNHLPDAERKAAWRDAQDNLAKRIAEYRPDAIVVLLKNKKFQRVVKDAVAEVVSTDNIHAVPFPGMGNLPKFRTAMLDIVESLLRQSCEQDGFLAVNKPTIPAPALAPASLSAHERGLAALDQDDFDAAIAEFAAAINKDPRNTFSYIRRAEAYEKKGDPASAIADYRKVLKLVDDETGAQFAAKIRKLEKTKK
jgi:tetratricopeptide (TPR) repeat protein